MELFLEKSWNFEIAAIRWLRELQLSLIIFYRFHAQSLLACVEYPNGSNRHILFCMNNHANANMQEVKILTIQRPCLWYIQILGSLSSIENITVPIDRIVECCEIPEMKIKNTVMVQTGTQKSAKTS